MGSLAALLGGLVCAGSLALGAHGWEITRLWFWLLGGALLLLVGGQLVLFGALFRVLQRLDARAEEIDESLRGEPLLLDAEAGVRSAQAGTV